MKKVTTMGSRSPRLRHHLLFFSTLRRNPRAITSSSSSSSSSSESESDSDSTEAPPIPISTSNPQKPTNSFALTPLDLARINLLIPRLCASNHHSTAVDLAATALLLGNTTPQSLPLSALIQSLSSQPDVAHPMSLLTRLKYAPAAHPYLRPITTALVSSYLRRRNPRHALELYNWMAKPASPCPPDADVYRILVHGFCRTGMLLEGFTVLRAMVAAGFAVGGDLRKRVYNGLLREAMIREARDLDEAFAAAADDGGGDGFEKVLDLLDHVIANWEH